MEGGGESYQHMNTLTIVVLIYYCHYHGDRYLIKMFLLLQDVAITMVMANLKIYVHTTFVYVLVMSVWATEYMKINSHCHCHGNGLPNLQYLDQYMCWMYLLLMVDICLCCNQMFHYQNVPL